MRRSSGLIYAMMAVAVAIGVWAEWVRGQGAEGNGAMVVATSQAAEKGALPRKKTEQIRGFSLQIFYVKDKDREAQNAAYIKAIDDIADLGCTWVNLSVAARQEKVNSEAVIMSYEYMPLPKEMGRIIGHAKERGMGVMLMPIVLLKNTGTKDWRGVIAPPNWDEWFKTYNGYIVEMARLAQRFDVDVFCVGSELLSTEPFRDRWAATIAQIRTEYHGKLTYSANWDHYEQVTFWDKVDYIGMNNYNELGDKGATVAQMSEKWVGIKKKILDFAAGQGKNGMPFMFTEVGWHNLDNTIKEPWNYVAKDGKLDNKEQLHAFESFVETWQEVPNKQFMGAYIWEWCPGGDGTKDWGTYSLQNTPAMNVVRKWFAQEHVHP